MLPRQNRVTHVCPHATAAEYLYYTRVVYARVINTSMLVYMYNGHNSSHRTRTPWVPGAARSFIISGYCRRRSRSSCWSVPWLRSFNPKAKHVRGKRRDWRRRFVRYTVNFLRHTVCVCARGRGGATIFNVISVLHLVPPGAHTRGVNGKECTCVQLYVRMSVCRHFPRREGQKAKGFKERMTIFFF